MVAVSHEAAAVVHGIRASDTALPEISVVGTALPILHGVKVHRTAALEERDVQIVNGIPAAVGVRMLADLAGVLPDERYVPLLDDTICSRVASRARAHDRAVELRPGRPLPALPHATSGTPT